MLKDSGLHQQFIDVHVLQRLIQRRIKPSGFALKTVILDVRQIILQTLFFVYDQYYGVLVLAILACSN